MHQLKKIPDISAIEKQITLYLSETLNLPAEQLCPDEFFFTYGISSLTAVNVTANLMDWLNTELDPMIFWDYPSIEKLAQYLNTEHINHTCY